MEARGSVRRASRVGIEGSISKMVIVTGGGVLDRGWLDGKNGLLRWSWRFSPTAGFSTLTSIPASERTCRMPMPESSRSWGDCTLPAQMMTSPETRIWYSWPR